MDHNLEDRLLYTLVDRSLQNSVGRGRLSKTPIMYLYIFLWPETITFKNLFLDTRPVFLRSWIIRKSNNRLTPYIVVSSTYL